MITFLSKLSALCFLLSCWGFLGGFGWNKLLCIITELPVRFNWPAPRFSYSLSYESMQCPTLAMSNLDTVGQLLMSSYSEGKSNYTNHRYSTTRGEMYRHGSSTFSYSIRVCMCHSSGKVLHRRKLDLSYPQTSSGMYITSSIKRSVLGLVLSLGLWLKLDKLRWATSVSDPWLPPPTFNTV